MLRPKVAAGSFLTLRTRYMAVKHLTPCGAADGADPMGCSTPSGNPRHLVVPLMRRPDRQFELQLLSDSVWSRFDICAATGAKTVSFGLAQNWRAVSRQAG